MNVENQPKIVVELAAEREQKSRTDFRVISPVEGAGGEWRGCGKCSNEEETYRPPVNHP
jgi:hypothetical protein